MRLFRTLQIWFTPILAVTCASVSMIAVAADLVLPGRIMPRRQPDPPFTVLSVKEQRINLIEEHENQLFKVYSIHIRTSDGTWNIVMDQENKIRMQLFSPSR